MDSPESLLEVAQRHVQEGKRRIARQRAIIEEMERDRHLQAAAKARRIMATMEASLRLSQQHLDRLQQASKT
jgi:hypothetical protein